MSIVVAAEPQLGVVRWCDSKEFFKKTIVLDERRKLESYFCVNCGAEYNYIVCLNKNTKPPDQCSRLLRYWCRWEGPKPENGSEEKNISGYCVYGWFDKNLLVKKISEERMRYCDLQKITRLIPIFSAGKLLKKR